MSRAIIGDSDPVIVYFGNWTTRATVASNTNEYNSTIHQSTSPGDELSLKFHGTGCSVYGTLDSPGLYGIPRASFSVDGLVPLDLNSTGTILVERPDLVTSYVLLYQSPNLDKSNHTLNVKIKSPENPAAALYIDFLTVSAASEGTNEATEKGENGLDPDSLIGGVIAVMALLVVGGLVAMWLRTRRRKPRKDVENPQHTSRLPKSESLILPVGVANTEEYTPPEDPLPDFRSDPSSPPPPPFRTSDVPLPSEVPDENEAVIAPHVQAIKQDMAVVLGGGWLCRAVAPGTRANAPGR